MGTTMKQLPEYETTEGKVTRHRDTVNTEDNNILLSFVVSP